ncbi:MAG: GNAT family N-acetyltransferase [Candidatus Binatia bacterium]
MTMTIRPLEAADLPAADRIFRLAFGTFLGLPEPLSFGGDADYVHTRWQADPSATFAAVADGTLLGSNFAARWGRFALFGPLTVHPDHWDAGIAQQLLAATMRRFDEWGITHAGLFTFSNSPKHLVLYQRYGFVPRCLTGLLAGSVTAAAPAASYSALAAGERGAALADCRDVAGALLTGLDLTGEIEAVQAQGLGDTVLVRDGGALAAFAVCHVGPGTEAGSGVCYIKFGAVRPGPTAAVDFARLVDACHAYAATRGAAQLVAGVNTARDGAYRALLARGMRIVTLGVAMQRPSEPGYNHGDAWVIDDWR